MELKARYLPFWGKYDQMIHKMSDQDAGRMIKAMSAYYFGNQEPENLPPKLDGLWYFIQMDIDDAQNRYDQKVLSGQKGGERSAQVRRQKAEEKQNEAPSSTSNQEEQITITESRTRSRTGTRTGTRSRTNTDTGCAQPPAGGVSVEKQTFGEFGWVKLTGEEYRQLETQWGKEELQRCIAYVDESAQSTGNRNRWKDWLLVLKKCHRDHWHEPKQYKPCNSVPMGATGYLGEPELESIRRVLTEDIPSVILPGEENEARLGYT